MYFLLILIVIIVAVIIFFILNFLSKKHILESLRYTLILIRIPKLNLNA